VISQSPLGPGELCQGNPLIAAQSAKVRYHGLRCVTQMFSQTATLGRKPPQLKWRLKTGLSAFQTSERPQTSRWQRTAALAGRNAARSSLGQRQQRAVHNEAGRLRLWDAALAL